MFFAVWRLRVILALVLSCFPAPLGHAPAANSTWLGQRSLGDTHHFYFVNQPTGKIRSLVTLTDLKLFCNNNMLVWLFLWEFGFFHHLFFYKQIDLTQQRIDCLGIKKKLTQERFVTGHLIANHLVVKDQCQSISLAENEEKSSN